LLFAYVYERASTTFTVVPTGWNLVAKIESSGGNHTSGLWWKIAEAGDDTTPTWTLGASAVGFVVIRQYNGADTTSPIDDSDAVGDPTASTSHTIPTGVTTTGVDRLCEVFWGHPSATVNFTAPSPWVEAFTPVGAGSSGTSRGIGGFTQTKAAEGSVGGESWSTGAVSSRVAQIVVAIKPAPAAAQPVRLVGMVGIRGAA
jgi:hypothetical protein